MWPRLAREEGARVESVGARLSPTHHAYGALFLNRGPLCIMLPMRLLDSQ
jgi:hypothetical protein